MDGEDWGMGCSGTVSREEGSRGGGGWSLVEGYKGGLKKNGRWREDRKRGRAGGDECAAIYSSLSAEWVWEP